MAIKPNIKLIWMTPDPDEFICYIARVSNPKGQETNVSPERLISYLIRNQHWSPFEMASACLEINTTRDIGRQILRHRSFSFQEFSQRYADTKELPPATYREVRLQDKANRQSSIEVYDDKQLEHWWLKAQMTVQRDAEGLYRLALEMGIAKEVARAILPEGLTPTRMYMSGTFRSWIHYCSLRRDKSTQKEHRLLAQAAWEVLREHAPGICNAVKHSEYAEAYNMSKDTV